MRGNLLTFSLSQVTYTGDVYDCFCSFQYNLSISAPGWDASPFQGHTQTLNLLIPNGFLDGFIFIKKLISVSYLGHWTTTLSNSIY